jgi:hypothetical protein
LGIPLDTTEGLSDNDWPSFFHETERGLSPKASHVTTRGDDLATVSTLNSSLKWAGVLTTSDTTVDIPDPNPLEALHM